MITPSFKEFLKLSKQGNLIPVYRQINADLDTPVSAFLKIDKGDYAFLLESVEGQEKIARYSFLGSNPSLIFKSKGRNIELIDLENKLSRKFVTDTSPLDEIKKIMRAFKAVDLPGLPRFYGGMVGYLGYDMVRFFEHVPDKNPDDLPVPDCIMFLTDSILIFDHVNHTINIVYNLVLPAGNLTVTEKKRLYNKALAKIDNIYRQLHKPVWDKEAKQRVSTEVVSNCSRKEFEDAVKKAKRYIKKGDIIQVVLSQRFRLKAPKNILQIYRNLRSLNPSPYMYYLKFKDMALVGSSPEMLVRCEDGLIETRPIAGTRPRGKNDFEDEQLKNELLADEKERAEHVMLVDLGRNDLGRVSCAGTVKVEEFMTVEKYSHVMHIVSSVKGKLDNKKVDIYDVLKSAFPAGTVSGSPKIRAMEIIDEIEKSRRSTYAGCVGYFSFSHNMDTCITIRTILVKDGFAYIQAGAGIVADSVPAKEYSESVSKSMALVESIINEEKGRK